MGRQLILIDLFAAYPITKVCFSRFLSPLSRNKVSKLYKKCYKIKCMMKPLFNKPRVENKISLSCATIFIDRLVSNNQYLLCGTKHIGIIGFILFGCQTLLPAHPSFVTIATLYKPKVPWFYKRLHHDYLNTSINSLFL